MSAVSLAERQDSEADSVSVGEVVVVDEAAEDDLDAARGYSLSSYGADYTVNRLVKCLRNGTFFIPPFPRAYGWTQRQASRFIESLLLGMPIPGFFAVREKGADRHLVIDGRHRLKTLQYFFDKDFQGSDFRLQGVDARWRGKTIDGLDWDDRQTLGEYIAHVVVFQQEKPEDDAGIYSLFERLNTGESELSPQEIRSCVSPGRLLDLLRDINRNAIWRNAFGPESRRQKDRELILRFLAFFSERERYERPMREFLNDFTRRRRNIDQRTGEQYKKLFLHALRAACGALGERAFRPQNGLNAAVFDAVMVGLAKRLDNWPAIDTDGVRAAYDNLLRDGSFQAAYSRNTADFESVRTRFDLAERAFQRVQ